MANNINKVVEALRQFNTERDWGQFHDGKNLALALSIEASELNECFLWKKTDEADINSICEELADVFNYAIMIADKYNLDIEEICLKKIKKNSEKYPVNKAKGTATKYNQL